MASRSPSPAPLAEVPWGAYRAPPNPALDPHARVDIAVKIERLATRPSIWVPAGGQPRITLWLPIHGSIGLRMPGQAERDCRPGWLLLLDRVEGGGTYQNRPRDGRFANAWANLTGEACLRLGRAVLAQRGPLIDLDADPEGRSLLEGLFAQALSGGGGGPTRLAGRALRCLSHLVAPPAIGGGIGAALAVIERELGDRSLSVERLAAAAGCAASTFSRRFHAACGVAPYAYLLQRRIDRATEALSRDETLATIAERHGFRDAAHFLHSFKRIMGETPGRYRRRQFHQP